ncbi:MAG: hypothetical protein JF887_11665 [Candidatus Dormibacteraeota bacterium]|uniref:DUF2171 domain-containing protein n=1 Tax=Candidatus Amunia macphersoniae TaxID=3127014 RepID=A0A934NGJ3_9BACT|nr:hypothetical protein [Candidatus Dormibacteraeota bacterium]
MVDEEALSWRAIKPGHKVLGREGQIGTVHRVLADYGADIFHGVSLRRGLLGPELEITADHIERISSDSLWTALGAHEVEDLPAARGG